MKLYDCVFYIANCEFHLTLEGMWRDIEVAAEQIAKSLGATYGYSTEIE